MRINRLSGKDGKKLYRIRLLFLVFFDEMSKVVMEFHECYNGMKTRQRYMLTFIGWYYAGK